MHLSTQGFARASALPLLFAPRAACAPRLSTDLARAFALEYDAVLPETRPPFARPDVVFATRQGKISNRPVETITPLAAALGLPINAGHEDKDFTGLANHVLTHEKFEDKVVLICWHHEKLPQLARALGVPSPSPDPWPDPVFDRIWRVDYVNGSTAFTNLPQRLLFGDSTL
jgi:hypothetical protein